ncbi:MAG: rubrerythrin family protein [Treponema sp.]|jgi:rubrerythrin|nr:rubrerythrin family protein [Treponema sp.]
MASLKGSKTEANLRTAYAGESQARNKYIFFAAKAKADGYGNVARYFEDSALNEQEHAKLWFKYLDGIGTTEENLKAAIEGEKTEAGEMYPGFAKIAKEEGFPEIAERFDQVGNIEKSHEASFKRFLETLDKDTPAQDTWKCGNCGNLITAKNAPSTCPVCGNADIGWSGYKAYTKVKG